MASATSTKQRAMTALDRLDAAAGDASTFARRADFSKWSVGEHLEHLAAANALCLAAADALVQGSDERIVSRAAPKFLGRLVLLLGWIPRGKGKAPDLTRPPPELDVARLREALDAGRDKLTSLTPEALATARGALPHPALGTFDAVQWVRFTEIHVLHHLKIVDDILAAA